MRHNEESLRAMMRSVDLRRMMGSTLDYSRPSGTSADYTEVEAVIRATQNRSKKLVAQEFKKSYLYHRLVRGGQVMNVFDNQEVPIHVATPMMGKWMGRSDQLPDHQSSQLSMATWNNRYLVVPHGWNLMDIWENSNNPTKIFDIMDFATMEAAIAMVRALSFATFQGAGTKEPDGLGQLFQKLAVGSQTGTIGNISRATKTWWNSQYVQLALDFGFLSPNTQIPAGLLAAMDLIEACTIGTKVPSDLVTTKSIYKNFRRAMLETSTGYHLTSDKFMAQFGLGHFIFEGQVVSWDANCQADTVYALHINDEFDADRTVGTDDPTKIDLDIESVATDNILDLDGNLTLVRNPSVNMRPIDPRSPYRSLSQTQWMAHSYNLAVKRMADHGVAGSDTGARWATY